LKSIEIASIAVKAKKMSGNKEEKVVRNDIEQCDSEIARKLEELREMDGHRLKSPFTNVYTVRI
jgi:hypothetical protein